MRPSAFWSTSASPPRETSFIQFSDTPSIEIAEVRFSTTMLVSPSESGDVGNSKRGAYGGGGDAWFDEARRNLAGGRGRGVAPIVLESIDGNGGRRKRILVIYMCPTCGQPPKKIERERHLSKICV